MIQPPRRLNCWEYRLCGREHGGLMVSYLGECPVSTALKYDGLNSGLAAGRACWLVAEAICVAHRPDGPSGAGCHDCEFYRRVVTEEAGDVQAAFVTVQS